MNKIKLLNRKMNGSTVFPRTPVLVKLLKHYDNMIARLYNDMYVKIIEGKGVHETRMTNSSGGSCKK